MKKKLFSPALILILILGTYLFISGCFSEITDYFTRLSAVEYNNEVVEILNNTSNLIEETTKIYDEKIPNIVTEESEIEVSEMKTAFEKINAALPEAEKVLTLKSKNIEQETEIKAEFENYLERAEAYLQNYQTMLNFYESGEFKTALEKVAEYDETLHLSYNDSVESNNNLVDILDQFI